eukprot:COSAG01_NODE_41644_length_448_cov_69.114613_1_plen_58_part_10
MQESSHAGFLNPATIDHRSAHIRISNPLTLSVGLILSDRGSFFYLKSAARSLQPENSA